MASQSARRDTSTCNVIAVPPSASTSREVSAAPTSSMSAIAIAAPCAANSSAAARPCPDAAPVISATFPRARHLRARRATVGSTRTRVNEERRRCVASRRIARLGLRCGVPTDPIAEYGALFVRDGERFVPTPLGARAVGLRTRLHGGAPSALLAHVLARHDPGPASFVARLTVELLRPVPLVPLQAVARTIRPGRKVQWLEGDAARRWCRGRARDRAAAASATTSTSPTRSRPRSSRRRRPFPRAHHRQFAVLRPGAHRLLVRERHPARRAVASVSRARRPRGCG